MANPCQEEKSTQGIEDEARRTAEMTAENIHRLGQTAAEQTEQTMCVGQAAAEAGEESGSGGR